MLIHDFAYVDRPIAAVAARLRPNPSALLTALALAAREDEDALRLRVGPFGEAGFLSRTVRVTCGEPVTRGDVVILPVTWSAEHLAAAFPAMQADLELAPLGDDRTQLTLMGRYEPPLGGLGRGLDRLLLHRVAQATVRSFLSRLGRSLDEGGEDELERLPRE